ncbi:unnamed protein product [Closterium sp. NIES-65]|nr:unnamed protein product [Closterium sp. NIES-65]
MAAVDSSLDVKRSEEIKEAANRAFQEHKFLRAVDLYTDAIQLNESNAILWANRAFAHTKIEEYGSAVEDAAKAIELNPSYVKLPFCDTVVGSGYPAFAHTKIEDYGSAVEDAVKAIELNPSYVKAAKIAPRDSDAGKKLKECEKAAAKIAPRDPDARKKLKECEKAVREEAFQNAIASPDSGPVGFRDFGVDVSSIDVVTFESTQKSPRPHPTRPSPHTPLTPHAPHPTRPSPHTPLTPHAPHPPRPSPPTPLTPLHRRRSNIQWAAHGGRGDVEATYDGPRMEGEEVTLPSPPSLTCTYRIANTPRAPHAPADVEATYDGPRMEGEEATYDGPRMEGEEVTLPSPPSLTCTYRIANTPRAPHAPADVEATYDGPRMEGEEATYDGPRMEGEEVILPSPPSLTCTYPTANTPRAPHAPADVEATYDGPRMEGEEVTLSFVRAYMMHTLTGACMLSHTHYTRHPTADVEATYDGPRMEGEEVTLSFVQKMMDAFKNQKKLHRRYAYQILFHIREQLRALPSLVDIQVPDGQHITVCGDIHGQLFDLMNIFDLNGLPSETNPYLFNGDFVDRGSFSVECIFTLFAFKCLYPTGIYLSRGNHESWNPWWSSRGIYLSRGNHESWSIYGFDGEVKAKCGEPMVELFADVFCCLPASSHTSSHPPLSSSLCPLSRTSMNRIYGFDGEVKAKCGEPMVELFADVFCCLPLAHVISSRVFVVHGGLFSKDGVSLDDVRGINRFQEPPDEGLMCEVLWSDPFPGQGRMPSKRGVMGVLIRVPSPMCACTTAPILAGTAAPLMCYRADVRGAMERPLPRAGAHAQQERRGKRNAAHPCCCFCVCRCYCSLHVCAAGLMCEVLWSDPFHGQGRMPSKRGVGVAFGSDVTKRFLQDNKLDLVVRSHEVKEEGYEEEHEGQLITVFSAPNYCDQMGNKGAFIRFQAPDLKPNFTTYTAVVITVFSAPNYCDQMGNKGSFIRFQAPDLKPNFTTYTAVPHPNVRPMAYASNFSSFF